MTTSTISLYQRAPEIRLIQRALNEIMRVEIPINGVFDPITQAVMGRMQSKIGLKESNRYGACYGPVTRQAIHQHIQERFLTSETIAAQASHLAIETCVLETVIETLGVEYGFMPDGELVLAFNERLFYDLYSKAHGIPAANALMCASPEICNPVMTHYCGGHREVERFKKAMDLDADLAIKSGTYGKFQIPGMTHEACGFEDPYSFYEYLKRSEDNQLRLLCKKIKDCSMLNDALIKKDWLKFHRKYFGAVAGIDAMADLFAEIYRSRVGHVSFC